MKYIVKSMDEIHAGVKVNLVDFSQNVEIGMIKVKRMTTCTNKREFG